jgi:hypothetical protein
MLRYPASVFVGCILVVPSIDAFFGILVVFCLILYASMLVVGMMVILFNLQQLGNLYPVITVGNVAAVLQMDLGCNKYLLWSMVDVAL